MKRIKQIVLYAEGRNGQRLQLVGSTYRTLDPWCAKEILPAGLEFETVEEFMDTIKAFLVDGPDDSA